MTSTRVMLAFLLVGVVAVAASALLVARISAPFGEARELHTPALERIQRADAVLADAVQEAFAYVLSGDASEKRECLAKLDEVGETLRSFVDVAQIDRRGEETERRLLGEIIEAQSGLAARARQLFRVYEGGGVISAAAFRELESAINEASARFDRLISHEHGELVATHAEALTMIKRSERSLWAVAAIVFGCALVIGGLARRGAARMEQARAEESAILAGVPAGVIALSPEMRVRWANPRFAEMLERSPESVAGAPWSALVPGCRCDGLETVVAGDRLWRVAYQPLDAKDRSTLAFVEDITEEDRARRQRESFIERILAVQDDERRRIARELHDDTGQLLAAMSVGLRELGDVASEELATRVERLEGLSSRLMVGISRLVRGLHPRILDELGLGDALDQLAREVGEAHGVEINVEVAGVGAGAGRHVIWTIYRVVQESLTNAVRHAGARHVELCVIGSPERIRVIVEDDGVGFDAAEVSRLRRGFGLRSIRERLAALDGRLRIESELGRGTTIAAEIPIAREAENV